MELKILCVGDVVGGPGREVLKEALGTIVSARGIDCVVVNAENVAAGSGLTPALYEKIVSHGADLITLGDHTYRRREIIPVLETGNNIVRPANLPPTAPGKDVAICTTATHHPIAVVSLLGRLYMKLPVDCPYRTVDRVLGSIRPEVKVIIVDMHAEATSEKIAMGWHLDGRVSVVFGTHTHVPTADARILPKGTAYITDLGMTGPYDSVLGRGKEQVLASMTSGVHQRMPVASADPRLCGILVSIDAGTGRATSIERVEYKGVETSGNP